MNNSFFSIMSIPFAVILDLIPRLTRISWISMNPLSCKYRRLYSTDSIEACNFEAKRVLCKSGCLGFVFILLCNSVRIFTRSWSSVEADILSPKFVFHITIDQAKPICFRMILAILSRIKGTEFESYFLMTLIDCLIIALSSLFFFSSSSIVSK